MLYRVESAKFSTEADDLGSTLSYTAYLQVPVDAIEFMIAQLCSPPSIWLAQYTYETQQPTIEDSPRPKNSEARNSAGRDRLDEAKD